MVPTPAAEAAEAAAAAAAKQVDFRVGDWRDTISLPTPGNVTIRFQPTGFTGMTLVHCHIVAHEDQGMMMPLQIIDPARAAAAPAAAAAAGAAAAAAAAAAPSSTSAAAKLPAAEGEGGGERSRSGGSSSSTAGAGIYTAEA